MSDEQKKILDMVEQGIITAEDAARLLKALGDSPDSDSGESAEMPEVPPAPEAPEAPPAESADVSVEINLENFGERIQSAAEGTVRGILGGVKNLLKNLSKGALEVAEAVSREGALSCETIDEDFQAAQAYPMTYPLMDGEVETLRIHWLRGNIDVRLTDEEHIKVTEYSQPGAAQTENRRLNWDDSELSISWNNRDHHGQEQPGPIVHLLVEFPRSSVQDLAEVEIKSIAGTLRLSDLKSEEISLSMVNGKMELSQLEAQDMSLSAVNGIITAQNVTAEDLNVSGVNGMMTLEGFCAEEADLNTVNGMITAKGNCGELSLHSVSGIAQTELEKMPEEAEIHTVSGTVSLGLPDDDSGFTVEFNRQSGAFQCDFPLQGELGTKSGEGVYGDGDAEIDAHTVSGLIKIYRV